MPQEALLCDEPWTAGVCNGAVSSVDLGGLINSAQPFDWSLIDPIELSALFVSGFGIVLTVWVVAFGASAVIEVMRKS